LGWGKLFENLLEDDPASRRMIKDQIQRPAAIGRGVCVVAVAGEQNWGNGA